MTAFGVMRANMIDGQILPNKITDVRLIDVLSKLPRELFVAQSQRSVAYIDDDIELSPALDSNHSQFTNLGVFGS